MPPCLAPVIECLCAMHWPELQCPKFRGQMKRDQVCDTECSDQDASGALRSGQRGSAAPGWRGEKRGQKRRGRRRASQRVGGRSSGSGRNLLPRLALAQGDVCLTWPLLGYTHESAADTPKCLYECQTAGLVLAPCASGSLGCGSSLMRLELWRGPAVWPGAAPRCKAGRRRCIPSSASPRGNQRGVTSLGLCSLAGGLYFMALLGV